MSHPRKAEAETPLPGVCFNMTLTASTLTCFLVLLFFKKTPAIRCKEKRKILKKRKCENELAHRVYLAVKQ